MLNFRVGDIWTERAYPQPFKVDKTDLLGNVFCSYLYKPHWGLTTRFEYVDRYRPIIVVGWFRKLILFAIKGKTWVNTTTRVLLTRS